MTTTLVKRPARIAPPERTSNELSIAAPPNRGQAPQAMAGLSMMMMPLMSGTGSVAVAVTQRSNPIMVVAAFLTLMGSIAIGAVMVISQRSGTKRQVRESRERYLDYVEMLRHDVRDQIAQQRAEQGWRHPRTDQLLEVARDPARRWERRPSHEDFLAVRLGTGTVPLAAGLTLDADTGPLNDFDPVCLQAAQELRERYATLSEQPIVLALREVGQLSVVGRAAARRALATNLVTQVAALHGPHDVQVAVVRSDEAAPAWDWVKWLPHVLDQQPLDGDVPARRITSSVATMVEQLAPDLETRLDRHARARGDAAGQRSHLVVVVDHDGLTAGHHLESPDPSVSLADLGVHVVSLVDTPRAEPETVDTRVEIAPDGSVTGSRWTEPFRLDVLPESVESTIARQLSGLRLTVEDSGDDGDLVDSVGLPEILGVDDPATLDLRRTWRPRAQRELLRVPIGVGATGRTVMLDIKESAHGGMGPHGLVVGATGSGKSEMLRTLVSSLIIGHSPDRLAMMLVDFKGGATFAPLEGVPHLAGMITNLQDDLTLVDRMRDALYGEMQRRQEVLKKAGNLPNVTAYQDKIDAGEPLETLPHLLVIVDEFSELLTAKPDFAELFVAIGRIGRSIGVHLLLASQKLETGKIRGLESHLSYRIGLRTFSESESRDAIGVPDAYHLPPEPGGGYLKVDTTVFERFKAAMVSDPYVPPSDGPRTVVPVVPFVATNGLGHWLASQSSGPSAGQVDGEAEGDASVLDVIARQLADSGAAQARQVWLDPLPPRMVLSDVADLEERGPVGSMSAALGKVDDAGKQRQFPLEWDFTGGGSNLVVIGSPATGKSVLLTSLIGSLALRYAPGDVVVYAIDFGGGQLHGLKDLPHVASVTGRTDPEMINRTVNDVMTVLEARESLFREHGLTSMRQLREARADGRVPADVPGDVFLVVDGWGVFRDEYDHLEQAIGDIAARGQNYGVHVVLTITQGLQVRMRMQAAFGGQLALRLNDVYDAPFNRKLMDQIPKDVPGRGVTDVDGELLFQTALPSIEPLSEDDGPDAGVPALVAAVKERWGDSAVQRVEVLPPLVTVDDLPTPSLGDDTVPIGLSELNLGPAGVNLFSSSPHLFVLGDGETGKSNLLKLLVKQLIATRSPDELGFVVIDYRRSLLQVVPEEYQLAYITNGNDAEAVTAEVGASLRERIPGSDVTPQQLRDRSWWSGLDVVVLVDDFDLVATSSGNPLQGFTDLVPQGYDLGFHLVLSRRVGGMSRALYDPLIQRLGDVGTPGIMFSGDRSEGRILNNVAPVTLPQGRALYVGRGGGGSQIQVARVDD